MKIPGYVQYKMKSALSAFQRAHSNMAEVNSWFDENYPEVDVRSGDGISLEEIEYGNDVIEVFCAQFDKITNEMNGIFDEQEV